MRMLMCFEVLKFVYKYILDLQHKELYKHKLDTICKLLVHNVYHMRAVLVVTKCC